MNGTETSYEPVQDDGPADDLDHLYIGKIVEAAGLLVTNDERELPIRLQGELLLYGQVVDDQFIVERVRRLALYGAVQSDNPEEVAQFGLLSLVAAETEVRQDGQPPSVSLRMQLHYAALSRRYEQAYRDDSGWPQVEEIAFSFSWDQFGAASAAEVQLLWVQRGQDWIKRKEELLKEIKVNSIPISFRLAGTGDPLPEPHYSLRSHCATPARPANCPHKTVTRRLPVRFVNYSQNPTTFVLANGRTIEDLCDDQVGQVCAIWRNKGALDLDVHGMVEGSAQQKTDYAEISLLEESQINGPQPGEGPFYGVEIYLVDLMANWDNGGVTYNGNVGGAYCILEIDRMIDNPYLLAHELCHVIGLRHPLDLAIEGGPPTLPGSQPSIAAPAAIGGQNSTDNTLANMAVFKKGFKLNALVDTTAINDCFVPDRLI